MKKKSFLKIISIVAAYIVSVNMAGCTINSENDDQTAAEPLNEVSTAQSNVEQSTADKTSENNNQAIQETTESAVASAESFEDFLKGEGCLVFS